MPALVDSCVLSMIAAFIIFAALMVPEKLLPAATGAVTVVVTSFTVAKQMLLSAQTFRDRVEEKARTSSSNGTRECCLR
jgi:hypothetical protein